MMIRELKESDIRGLNKLPPSDWSYDYEGFLTSYLADDFFYAFVMIQDEKIIGTGNVFLKGMVGWLANIIVDGNYRRKGLGFEMTKYLVDFLAIKGCETQLLLATELGEPVYSKVGFRKITDYQCFDTMVAYDFISPSSIRKFEYSEFEKVCQLDEKANGENRAHLINKYFETGLGYFDDNEEMLGFYLPDFAQGLVISGNKKVGNELLKLKHSEKGKRTLLPVENSDGIKFLENMGVKKGHNCARMILGKENNWNPKYIFSYGGGYCG